VLKLTSLNIVLIVVTVVAPGSGQEGPWPYLKMPGPTSGLPLDIVIYEFGSIKEKMVYVFCSMYV